jgi:hypothetical protein
MLVTSQLVTSYNLLELNINMVNNKFVVNNGDISGGDMLRFGLVSVCVYLELFTPVFFLLAISVPP